MEEINRNNDNNVSLKEYFDSKIKDVDDKFRDSDIKYQIQFNAAKEALGIALIAQEKDGAKGADSTKEAINKAEIATDKRFELISQKIDGVNDIINRNAGAQGIYVTHTDLSNEMSKLRADFELMLRPVVTFMNGSQGKEKGMDASWTRIAMIIAATATIITLLLKFVQ